MRAYALRLVHGQDIRRELMRFAGEKHIAAAALLSMVGCVSRARLRDATGVRVRDLDGDREIVSATGTVSAARTHVHIALADENLCTLGGHLADGCIVNTTAEIVLLELGGLRFSGAFDPQTGYDELLITQE